MLVHVANGAHVGDVAGERNFGGLGGHECGSKEPEGKRGEREQEAGYSFFHGKTR